MGKEDFLSFFRTAVLVKRNFVYRVTGPTAMVVLSLVKDNVVSLEPIPAISYVLQIELPSHGPIIQEEPVNVLVQLTSLEFVIDCLTLFEFGVFVLCMASWSRSGWRIRIDG